MDINCQRRVVTGWIHKLSWKGGHRVDINCHGSVVTGWIHKLSWKGGHRVDINCHGRVVKGWTSTVHKGYRGLWLGVLPLMSGMLHLWLDRHHWSPSIL